MRMRIGMRIRIRMRMRMKFIEQNTMLRDQQVGTEGSKSVRRTADRAMRAAECTKPGHSTQRIHTHRGAGWPPHRSEHSVKCTKFSEMSLSQG